MSYTEEEIKVNRVRWLEALESGDYRRASSTLKNSEGFCCLGVYTDLCPGDWQTTDIGRFFKYRDDSINEESEHSGYQSCVTATLTSDQQKQLGIDGDLQWELIYKNDEKGESFSEIARFLRERWKL